MSLGFSRLCPSFDDVINDPLLLSYFLQYLRTVDSENLFRFWLELSGCQSRKTNNDEPFQFKSEKSVLTDAEINELRQKISQLSVNDVTTIYVRYLSLEAKLAVELPPDLLSFTLLRILENPGQIAALEPCSDFLESKLRSCFFPDFIKNKLFFNFCSEIVLNVQLNLNDVLFDETLLVCFVEFLTGDPCSTLLTFLMAVNAYKKEFFELMVKEDQGESVEDRYEQLLHDATTICAKYLSPASDDFMGLTFEQYRDVLDAACSEKEPSESCFDRLYDVIFKTVEKNILPSFFVSGAFSRYRERFEKKTDVSLRSVRRNAVTIEKPLNSRLAPTQLDVLALADIKLSHRLPRVYDEEEEKSLPDTNDNKASSSTWRKISRLFKKDRFSDFSERLAYTGREILERSRKWRSFSAKPPSNCDVVVTFEHDAREDQVDWVASRLRARIPELIFTKTFHNGTRHFALYLTCSFKDLLKGAQEVRMRKRMREDCGGELQEFCIEDCENFEGIFDQENFFTSSERQTIVRYYLMSLRAMAGDTWDGHIKFSHGQAIMPILLAKGKVATIFPLHDREALKTLQDSWVRGFRHRQPLDSVAEYFGVKIALYFAWLGHYTTALVFPAAVGFLSWVLVLPGEQASLYHPVLAIFTMLWAVFFQEYWIRASTYYTHHWGTLDKLPSLLEEPQPLFKGALEPSPITGRLQPFYPRWKRHLTVCFVTIPITIVCLLIVVVVAVGHLRLQETVEARSANWWFPVAKMVPYIPMVLLALNIAVLNAVYHRIAVFLTELENHRLAESKNQALTIKLILFQFINAFYASFYIAFYRMDLDLLRQHLVTILVTRQIAGNLKEVLLPLGQTRIRQVYLTLIADGFPKMKKENEHANYDSQSPGDARSPTKPSEVKITRVEQEEIMPKYDDATDDYLEMFIQFGFVSMFTCAFPLCGLLALLNNILEIRSDAYKLLVNFQRPFAETANGIGVWERAFEIVSYVAIVVNIGLIGVSGNLKALFPSLSTHEHVLLLIAIEHMLFALRYGLAHVVPPIPLALERSMAILENKRREALRTLEREERKEARRISENDNDRENEYPSDQTSDIDSN